MSEITKKEWPEPRLEHLSIDAIVWDPEIQPRASLRGHAIASYKGRYAEGLPMDPVDVFYDAGTSTYWGAAGFHREGAARQAGLVALAAHVRDGTREDARLFAISSNLVHKGEPPDDKDRDRMRRQAITHDPGWSDAQVAALCDCHHQTVRSTRARWADELIVNSPEVSDEEVMRRTGIKADDLAQVRSKRLTEGRRIHAAELPKRPDSPNSRPQKKSPRFEDDGQPADEHTRSMDAQRRRAEDAAKRPEPIHDQLGNVVPDHLRDVFAAATLPALVEDLERMAEAVPAELRSMAERVARLSGAFVYLEFESIRLYLKEAAAEARTKFGLCADAARRATPHSVCTACEASGSNADRSICPRCDGAGYLTWWRLRNLEAQANSPLSGLAATSR